jgi:hypothetical protein
MANFPAMVFAIVRMRLPGSSCDDRGASGPDEISRRFSA